MSCPRPLFCRHDPFPPPFRSVATPSLVGDETREISCRMRDGGWQTPRDRARLTLGICDDVGWAILRCTTAAMRVSGMLCNQLTASRKGGSVDLIL